MGQNVGSFGCVSYNSNSITIEIEPNTLGSLALTSGDGRIECYWDGTQWVCNFVTFNQSESASQSATSA
jgi:hypothetical protein